MSDTTGLWGWAKTAWNGIKSAWNSPGGRIVRNVASVASFFIPGVGVIRGAYMVYKGYKLYKSLKAGGQAAKGLSATRGQSRVAGRLWAGAVRKNHYSYGGVKGYRLINPKTGRTYRSPTYKQNSSRVGFYSNFDHSRKIHVAITNPKRSWAR